MFFCSNYKSQRELKLEINNVNVISENVQIKLEMKLIHGSSLDDTELLHQIVLQVTFLYNLLNWERNRRYFILIVQELKVRGIEVKLETPKPSKKSFVPFSTPATNTPGANVSNSGRIFGRRLSELSKLLVSLDENQETDVLVPKLIVSACKYIEDNVEIEGIYRLSGSAARQKVINWTLYLFVIYTFFKQLIT